MLAGVLGPVVALAVVSGCAAGPDSRADTPAAPRTDDAAVRLAERILLTGCMREAGFDYRVTDPGPEPPDLGYVLTDAGRAREHGYGGDIRRRLEQAQRDDPNRRYLHGLRPARRADALAAMNGRTPSGLRVTTPDGVTFSRNPHSCESQAQQRLYGDLAAWFLAQTTVDMMDTLRTNAVLSDGAYHTAVASWSACMARSGYRYPDPQRLHAALQPSLPRAGEVAMAVAEARCAASSGLAGVTKRLDRRADAQLRAKYSTAAATYDRLRRAAVPRAWSIVRAS
jgi:hypothetical protein